MSMYYVLCTMYYVLCKTSTKRPLSPQDFMFNVHVSCICSMYDELYILTDYILKLHGTHAITFTEER